MNYINKKKFHQDYLLIKFNNIFIFLLLFIYLVKIIQYIIKI